MDSQSLSLLERTTEYFRQRGQAAYVVGGSLRDLLLGEERSDWDIVTGSNAHSLARRLADVLGGNYVRMHVRASRVVVKGNAEAAGTGGVPSTITIDVSPMQGASIEEDLRMRDFTINALAAPLDEMVGYLESAARSEQETGDDRAGKQGSEEKRSSLLAMIIDPTQGVQDIQARRLRAVNETVFRRDPLRLLRAVRFLTRLKRYGFSLERRTEGLILRDAALLPTVAAERIRDELYAILDPEGATGQLRLLDSLGLLTILIPELAPARGMRQPYPHYWDVLEHSLEITGALEAVARLFGPSSHPVVGTRLIASGMEEDKEASMVYDAPGVEGAINRAPTTRGERSTDITDDIMEMTRGERSTDITDDIMEIRNILQEAEQQGIFSFASLRAPRMKMAALLHDIGKPATYATGEDGTIHFYNHPQVGAVLAQQIMRRLSASAQDRRLAQQVAAHHMRPGQLGQAGTVTPRAIRRYFVDLGPTGILVALLSLADHLATFGPRPLTDAWERHLSVVRLLLASYVRERDSILPPRLLTAEELMRRLKLDPGPRVGELLEQIAEAQAEGRVHSREEALWLAEELVNRE